jgi:hypothetical protein
MNDKDRRLVLITEEYDARTAAMLRADVQATLPDVKVVVARVVTMDLTKVATRLMQEFGNPHALWEIVSDDAKLRSNQRRFEQALREARPEPELIRAVPIGKLNVILSALHPRLERRDPET